MVPSALAPHIAGSIVSFQLLVRLQITSLVAKIRLNADPGDISPLKQYDSIGILPIASPTSPAAPRCFTYQPCNTNEA